MWSIRPGYVFLLGLTIIETALLFVNIFIIRYLRSAVGLHQGIHMVWAVALCLTGSVPLAISMMTLLYTLTIDLDHMHGIEVAVCVTYECHNQIQAHSSSWFVAGLWYLQCICNGDAAVLHKTIDRVYGQCPGACLAPGHCLYLW